MGKNYVVNLTGGVGPVDTGIPIPGSGSVTPAPGTPSYNPAFYALTDVYVDPANSTGNASDANIANNSATAPMLTWNGVVQAYGSTRVQLPFGQHLVVHVLSAWPSNSTDEIHMQWLPSGGGYVVLDCTPAWVAAGADFALGALTGGFGFAAATPTAGGVAMTAATTPAYVVGGVVVENTARASYAMADTNTAGSCTFASPQTKASIGAVASAYAVTPNPVRDSDWVAGDNCHAWTLPNVPLKSWEAISTDFVGAVPASAWVIGASVNDTSGVGANQYQFVGSAIYNVLSLCVLPRVAAQSLAGRGQNQYIVGCYVTGLLTTLGGLLGLYGSVIHAGIQQSDGVLLATNFTCVHGAWTNYTGLANLNNFFGDGSFGSQGSCAYQSQGTAYGTFSMALSWCSTYRNSSGGSVQAKGLLTTGTLSFADSGSTNGLTAGVGGTFIANGATQVDVAPAGGQHFPANAPIDISMNTFNGATQLPFFSASQGADAFHIKSNAGDASTYNWWAQPALVAITPANIDTYKMLTDQFSQGAFIAV